MAHSDYERHLEMLARKRAPGVAAAIELIREGRFEDADRAVTALDSSIYGAVELTRLYRERLEAIAADGAVGRELKEATFRKALSWAVSAYPEPHTAIEADQYDRGRAESRARLVGILGYDPG